MGKAIMFQGTGSNVGKSLIVAGLCRHFARQGLRVQPFKPQNMSNNAAVTADGGEIGRAQGLQARACYLEPHTDMNPVLLKPESETGAQVIVQGHRLTTVKARDYAALKPAILPKVLESFARLRANSDLVIVEGAGSPAEINLRQGDIANMGFAEAADVPVILIGDIDRGGVIAQIAGTRVVLSPQDASRIKAFLINKFRGDPALFSDGLASTETLSHWPSLGLIPWFPDAHKLPAEDALDLRSGGTGAIKIAVPLLSRIANFDDFDPLKAESGVTLHMIPPGQPIPADTNLIVLPGTKSTIADLAFLRQQGWDIDILAHARQGKPVLGICGGYQMLGRMIHDPDGIEGPPGRVSGLALLDVETTMLPDKTLRRVSGTCGANPIQGYEIHLGATTGADTKRPMLTIQSRPEGATSSNGQIQGCYIHGLFAADGFRHAFITALGGPQSTQNYDVSIEQTLNALADHIARHVDCDELLKIAT